MRGLWLESGSLRFRDDLPLPVPGPGDALVRVRLAGICGTDLALTRGYYPYAGIPGHEFVGDVVEAASPGWQGVRVVGEVNAACGHCETCRSGRGRHCEQRTVLGIRDRAGAFAEYLLLPEANLHAVPASVSDAAAVFSEPLAAALEIQEQTAIRPSDRVLLVGAGRLGQLIAWTLALTGCRLEVVARYPRQQELLTARGIPTIEETAVPPRHYDLAVEATGSPGGFDLARRAVRPGGTVVLKSTYRGEITVNLAALVVDEITLLGSRCGPFAPALRLLERRSVDPVLLVDSTHGLREGPAALALAARPGALKVLLRP